ncbi:MAG: hypothetical protein ABID38_05030 [Candidatus Diapherotrites archaeon]
MVRPKKNADCFIMTRPRKKAEAKVEKPRPIRRVRTEKEETILVDRHLPKGDKDAREAFGKRKGVWIYPSNTVYKNTTLFFVRGSGKVPMGAKKVGYVEGAGHYYNPNHKAAGRENAPVFIARRGGERTASQIGRESVAKRKAAARKAAKKRKKK